MEDKYKILIYLVVAAIVIKLLICNGNNENFEFTNLDENIWCTANINQCKEKCTKECAWKCPSICLK